MQPEQPGEQRWRFLATTLIRLDLAERAPIIPELHQVLSPLGMGPQACHSNGPNHGMSSGYFHACKMSGCNQGSSFTSQPLPCLAAGP